jgi:hypothetical protein
MLPLKTLTNKKPTHLIEKMIVLSLLQSYFFMSKTRIHAQYLNQPLYTFERKRMMFCLFVVVALGVLFIEFFFPFISLGMFICLLN